MILISSLVNDKNELVNIRISSKTKTRVNEIARWPKNQIINFFNKSENLELMAYYMAKSSDLAIQLYLFNQYIQFQNIKFHQFNKFLPLITLFSRVEVQELSIDYYDVTNISHTRILIHLLEKSKNENLLFKIVKKLYKTEPQVIKFVLQPSERQRMGHQAINFALKQINEDMDSDEIQTYLNFIINNRNYYLSKNIELAIEKLTDQELLETILEDDTLSYNQFLIVISKIKNQKKLASIIIKNKGFYPIQREALVNLTDDLILESLFKQFSKTDKYICIQILEKIHSIKILLKLRLTADYNYQDLIKAKLNELL